MPGVLPLDSLLARWRGEAVSSLLPGAKADDIRAAFEQAHSHATADIVRLYERIGGMEISDNDWWLLWSLPEIVEAGTDVHPFGAQFSDYMLNCWTFRAKPVSAEVSEVYIDHHDSKPPLKVASSIDEFLAALETDPMRVINPGAWARSKSEVPDR